MDTINRWLTAITGRQDTILALVFICAIFMMILPMPTFLVDLMIAVNISVSLLLLMIAIYTRSAADFSCFPSVLLITTLYRLALTISTSRLILLQHNAGEIVTAFGNFVVGGNLTVGLIIFMIITIVQFVVITKGSERVAEVSARFSLDAMPGKQMSIDGDMRAGTIDAETAQRLRNRVQQESQLYGAMDGAMKFVKGDSVAGIIVILVNIIGGIIVGVLQHGMSASEALTTYAILSVGDGLVSQIPALLISITAGIIVTRVPGEAESNLGSELFQQLGHHAQPLWIASAILCLFAVFPGFPTLAFGAIAALLAILGYYIRDEHAKPAALPNSKKNQAMNWPIGATPISLKLPKKWDLGKTQRLYQTFMQTTFDRLGLALSEFRIESASQIELFHDDQLVIFIYQEPACIVTIPSNCDLRLAPNQMNDPPGQVAAFELAQPYAYWVPSTSTIPTTETDGTSYQQEAILTYCMEQAIRHYARDFIGIQEVRFLMDSMESRYSELVKELQRQVPMAKLAEVLQRLVEEQVSIKNLRNIFESLINWAPKEKDLVLLTEYVRISLKRQLISNYASPEGVIRGWSTGDNLESIIRESVRQSSAGSYSSLDPEQTVAILNLIKQKIGPSQIGIVITAVDVRRYLRKLLEKDLFDVAVLSKQELGSDATIEVLGNIEWIESEDDNAQAV